MSSSIVSIEDWSLCFVDYVVDDDVYIYFGGEMWVHQGSILERLPDGFSLVLFSRDTSTVRHAPIDGGWP